MSERVYVVCDGCGNLTERTEPWPMDTEWGCAHCQSSAAWEFTSEQSARRLAANLRMFESGFDPASSAYDRSAEAS